MDVCGYCEEEILATDHRVPVSLGTRWLHRECLFRMVTGGRFHIERKCHCYLGDQGCEPDNPALNRRQQAIEAFEAFHELHGTKTNN